MRVLARAAIAACFLLGCLALVTAAHAGKGDLQPPVAAETPSPQLMRALMAFASPHLGLPVPSVMPTIVHKTDCQIQAIALQTEDCPEEGAGQTFLALYHGGVMWLSDDWRGDNLRDLAILLHELVHHMQHHAGVAPVPCQAEAIEKPAYAVHMAFLEAAGVDPYKTIGINELMLIMVTSCLFGPGGM